MGEDLDQKDLSLKLSSEDGNFGSTTLLQLISLAELLKNKAG